MFKIGDWVRTTKTVCVYESDVCIPQGEIHKISSITLHLFTRYINETKDKFEPWLPQQGELCCKKFSSKCFVVGPYGIPGFTEEHLEKGHLEPFVGEKSSFIKDKE